MGHVHTGPLSGRCVRGRMFNGKPWGRGGSDSLPLALCVAGRHGPAAGQAGLRTRAAGDTEGTEGVSNTGKRAIDFHLCSHSHTLLTPSHPPTYMHSTIK